MITKYWNRIPIEERKFLAGALVALVASGALTVSGHGNVTFDGSLAGLVLIRYVTDKLGIVVPTQNVVVTPPYPAPPVPPVAPTP